MYTTVNMSKLNSKYFTEILCHGQNMIVELKICAVPKKIIVTKHVALASKIGQELYNVSLVRVK